MKLLGFTVQKPLYQAWPRDSVLVRQWEVETYPDIKAEAKAVGATIYFADESGIRSDYPRVRLGHVEKRRSCRSLGVASRST